MQQLQIITTAKRYLGNVGIDVQTAYLPGKVKTPG